jgi:carboxylesterase type B
VNKKKFGLPKVCENRTCHASELPFVFDAADNADVVALNVTFTADELQLIAAFEAYWAAFVITGDPNAHNTTGLPAWPLWDAGVRSELLMQTPTPAVISSEALCSFWDSIGYDHVQ